MSRPNRKTQRRASTAPAVVPEARKAEGGSGEFKPNYTFVIKDLRRIGLLAGSLIVALILLSFFLK